MTRIQTLFLVMSFLVSSVAVGQTYTFPTDSMGIGYISRPYERYEAEEGLCVTTGQFIARSDDQRTVAAEASHQQAVELTAEGQCIAWVVNQAGNGLTIRFSLPDSSNGEGTTAEIAILAGADTVGKMQLSSYWAWQYCNDNYPDNQPRSNALIRMKFDENHLRLSRPIESGETMKVVLLSAQTLPCSIDFVELEPVPEPVRFEDIDATNKLQFDGNGDIADWIRANEGKTLYVPEGRYETSQRIYLRSKDNTQLIGAGMWYSEIYYNASSENLNTYDKRGIEASKSNLLVEGLYFNTVNRQRYYNCQDSKQVGKAFMGGWGKNSVIRQCWAEHFECGAWIADYSGNSSENLLIEHCRFRNNYADGVNCSQASNGHTVRYCSFRNNGDDDMASWSTGVKVKNITFAYCTAENNWRASSLGFFGGQDHQAHHIAIFDAMESGARVNADFAGTGFSGNITIENMYMEHCGCTSGTKGVAGDFWGGMQGALNIGNTSNYSVQNVHMKDIQIVDSRMHAIVMRSTAGNNLDGLQLENIRIQGANGYGIYYSNASGNVCFCNLSMLNCQKGEENSRSATLHVSDCATGVEEQPVRPFSLAELHPDALVYDVAGRLVGQGIFPDENGVFIVLHKGQVYKFCR